MPVHYDPNIIHQHAQRLYERARAIIVTYGALGLLFGLLAGSFVGEVWDDSSSTLVILATFLFGAAGVLVGRAKSFELRLQAQTALCQVQIEINSRPSPAPSYVAPGSSA